jgi:hypothetical protein
LIEALPVHRIRAIHIAGGTEVQATTGDRRILDDHRHAVPDSVYRLLELVGERVPQPLDVILERDGAFPPFEQLLGELDRARQALAAGRARRSAAAEEWPLDEASSSGEGHSPSSASGAARARHARFEGLLARLFTDRALRERFLADPVGEGLRAGLDGEHLDALVPLDRPGLELAAASFARKQRARRA